MQTHLMVKYVHPSKAGIWEAVSVHTLTDLYKHFPNGPAGPFWKREVGSMTCSDTELKPPEQSQHGVLSLNNRLSDGD